MSIRFLLPSLIAVAFVADAVAYAQCPPPGKSYRRPPGRPNPGLPSGPTVPVPTGPTTPTRPGPTTPARPTPSFPSAKTPTGRAPTTGGPTTKGPRGAPIVFTRGRTAKQRLDIDWDVPVYRREKSNAQSTAAAVGKNLTFDAALAFIRGKDPRPLLVLRECHLCVGTDFALLSRAMQNDRTMLLTHWFHCVKLPASVMHKDHALRKLFGGKQPPHLFFATASGDEVETLPGNQNQSDLWKKMTGILRKSYKGNAAKNVKALLRLLNDFDALDSSEAQLRRRLDRAVESGGPKSAKFKKLRTQLRGLEKRRTALLAREKRLRDLEIR